MKKYGDLEKRIREIGEEIYSSAGADVPSVFDKTRWAGKAMEWAMKSEDFKIRLFRFIDVLPALKTDDLVVRLLKEYFSDDREFQGMLKWGIKGLPASGLVTSLTSKLIRQNGEALARQFIAGEDLKDSLHVFESLREDGLAFGIDLLGEVVVSEKEVRGYIERYIELLASLHPVVSGWPEVPLLDNDDRGALPALNVSLKVSSFYSQLDPVDWDGSIENAKNSLRPVFRKAVETGASVTFDMEHYYFKDLTIAIFKSILEEEEFRDLPFAGIAMQTYLKDAEADLEKLIVWAKEHSRRIAVRLVKGAYWDYEIVVNRQRDWPVPIFLNKGETDHNYEKLTRTILEQTEHIRPELATHNLRSISHSIAVAESLGIPGEGYEFQMLYGMAEPLRHALKERGYRTRIYTPVGKLIPGMSYLVRRLLENTSNESFLKKSFIEKQPFDELIKAPQPLGTGVSEEKVSGFKNEPPLDFSKSENRERMRDALTAVKEEFNKKYPLYIGGREMWKEKQITSVNPARPEEVIGTVSVAENDDAEKAVEEARRVFFTWGKTPVEERAGCLFRAADEMRQRRFEFAALEVYEVGKSWKEADGDVAEAIDYMEFYGQEMLRLGASRRLGNLPGEINEYMYEPKGIGVVIAPWNFPLAISAGMVSAGIVTGNCVIYKPSGLSPVCGGRLVELFMTAGLPDGALQLLNGPGEVLGRHLVAHPDIDFIAFTGSRAVGLNIIESAGKTPPGQRNVKRVIAEMGGKNALIIDETADLDDAVKGVLESALGYQGQKCSACSRVIVAGAIHDEFCDRLREAMDSIHIGPPEDPCNFMGPMIDEAALKKTRSFIDSGKDHGEEFYLRSIDAKGYFAGPAIFTEVDPDSPLAQEEIFGPVLSIMRAKNIDEAIEIGNNTPYALTGGIFSRSPAHIEIVRKHLNVGNLYINRKITGAIVGRHPFGGFGMSGVGSKAGGPDYLLQFMNPKSISENIMRKGFSPLE